MDEQMDEESSYLDQYFETVENQVVRIQKSRPRMQLGTIVIIMAVADVDIKSYGIDALIKPHKVTFQNSLDTIVDEYESLNSEPYRDSNNNKVFRYIRQRELRVMNCLRIYAHPAIIIFHVSEFILKTKHRIDETNMIDEDDISSICDRIINYYQKRSYNCVAHILLLSDLFLATIERYMNEENISESNYLRQLRSKSNNSDIETYKIHVVGNILREYHSLGSDYTLLTNDADINYIAQKYLQLVFE